MPKVPYVLSPVEELAELEFRAELPDGSVRIDTPQFDEFRLGPEVQWLWPGRIPRGMVTLIEGVEGAGKSFVALDIAARVSRGLGWPGLPAENREGERRESKGEVLILCRPDDCRSAGRRLAALGADFQGIRRLKDFVTCEAGENRRAQRPLAFPCDLPTIESELRRGSLDLVVIDSLPDFCPLPQQVAQTLRRLNELAEEFGVAIVVTMPAHCRCDGQGVLRVTSRYQTGGARCVWAVLADPDVPARRVFIARRTNFCEEPAGLEFRFDAGRIVWNPVSIEPADPLGLQAGISICLTEALRDGSRSAAEVLREGQQCGFTPKQLRSAAKRLGIESRKSSGFGADGGWTWWTAEQWAERVARPQALGARSVVAEAAALTEPDETSASQPQLQPQSRSEAPADRSSSRLPAGPVWVNPDGTVSQFICKRGDEIMAEAEARAAARKQTQMTTPTPAVANAGAPASPVAPLAEILTLRMPSAPAGKPQAESSKNEESLKKLGDFQRPVDGPLPHDGYARRQERKRRQRERDEARKRVPRP